MSKSLTNFIFLIYNGYHLLVEKHNNVDFLYLFDT